MKHVTIKLKKKLKYRLDMSFLSEIQDYKSIKSFLSKKIHYGNKLVNINSLFTITGSVTSKIVIRSAVNYMDNIGVGLNNIQIIVYGDVGFSFVEER